MASINRRCVALAIGALVALPSLAIAQGQRPISLAPGTMKRVGQIEERYQSYNIEMLEVTGGRFWKPYKDIKRPAPKEEPTLSKQSNAPAGMSADLYQYRPPIDLTNPRLRAMAAALSPAYVRISGTWANTTYFADTDAPPKAPPAGYNGVLTRQQWLGAIAFSRAVDAPIVTSVPNSKGTRGASEVWKPDQAGKWLAFTKFHGGKIAAAEYFNEPTLATMGGAPHTYDAAAFGRDFQVFAAFMHKNFPDTKLLAPGSVGEADADWSVALGGYGNLRVLHADDLAQFTGAADAFSYHHYGAASQRCVAMGHQTSSDQALSEDWLGRTDKTLDYYRQVRDRFMSGKPFWNTERRMLLAAEIPGPARSLIPSATLTSLGGSRVRMLSPYFTIHLLRATTDCWTKIPSNPNRTIGAPYSGADTWEQQCLILV